MADTNKSSPFTSPWVAISTFLDAHTDQLIEEGGVYAAEPHARGIDCSRRLRPDEPVVACPQCGRRFAASDSMTPEECRELHVAGDEDIPSICPGVSR